MKNIIVIVIMAIATASHATGIDHGNEAGKQQPTNVTQQIGVKQSARAEARAQAKASARSSAAATGGTGIGGNSAGGTGIGGNSEATGGAASATGGQIVVNGTGSGSGLTGTASSPITSTSCRNGITAGGSGNGWVGLISLFSEDEICELRLLLEQFRTAGQHDKADKLLDGMMLMRCEKLSPDSRKLFGDLCPKPAPSEIQQNAAFSSAG